MLSFHFQPRILMAMARDGLLPSFFSDISECTQVPVKSTITTGIFAAALAFFMDVSQLAGMVSKLMFIHCRDFFFPYNKKLRELMVKDQMIDEWFFLLLLFLFCERCR